MQLPAVLPSAIPMNVFPLKPTHKPVKAYFETLALFLKHGHTTEGNTRADDPKYILRLIGQVITVSLETNTLIASLPPLQSST